jgi:hypothetical protein
MTMDIPSYPGDDDRGAKAFTGILLVLIVLIFVVVVLVGHR